MSKKNLFSFLLVLAIFSVWTIPVHAAYLRGVPVHVTQPDGTVLICLASGDEYYNWLHDKNGYTIMRNPATGFLVYANKVDGRLLPTEFIAGRTDALMLEQAGIKAGLLDGVSKHRALTRRRVARELFDLAHYAQEKGWSAEDLLRSEAKRRERALRAKEKSHA